MAWTQVLASPLICPERYPHLTASQLALTEIVTTAAYPSASSQKFTDLSDNIASELETDFGVASDTAEPRSISTSDCARKRHAAGTAPSRGLRPEIHPDSVDPAATPMATGSAQITVETKTLEQEFLGRIAAKDRDPNNILIVTTGLPDEAGYACPADHFIFYTLNQRLRAGLLKVPITQHLSADNRQPSRIAARHGAPEYGCAWPSVSATTCGPGHRKPVTPGNSSPWFSAATIAAR